MAYFYLFILINLLTLSFRTLWLLTKRFETKPAQGRTFCVGSREDGRTCYGGLAELRHYTESEQQPDLPAVTQGDILTLRIQTLTGAKQPKNSRSVYFTCSQESIGLLSYS